MTDKYRFIRTGYQPDNQIDDEDIICSCFAFCTDEMRVRLERFFVSPGKMTIEFKFDRPTPYTVRLEKIQCINSISAGKKTKAASAVLA